jgi:anthranilate synthase component 1
MHIERYSHVIHIVSNVRGELAEGKDAFDALFSCFPAGTLTGAPKIRAMEIIDEIEPVKRGLYGGALGYIGWSGTMDTCIVIRTIVYKGGVATIQAGAGIVADSDPGREYNETLQKAGALFTAITRAARAAGR